MATYIQRATDIIEAAIDAVPTAAQLNRVADAFTAYAPDILEAVAVDPENPTNAEKAEVFVRSMRRWGKSVLRATAEKGARDANEGNVAAAGDAAEGDL